MTRQTLRRVVSAGLLSTAGALVIATWPSAAQADQPVRAAWWNTASGGGQSAPQPTTADGGLHVAVAPGQILAYGAVLYSMAQDATATLELKVSGQGTPVLVACPTKDTSWKAGGDQPASDAPAYDCSLHSYTGSVSSDGTTVTFLLDGSAESTPGELSLAIVPYMTHDAPGGVGTELPTDSTVPFSVDIAPPDVSSLTVTSGSSTGQVGSPKLGGSQPPTVTPAGSGSTTAGSTGGAQVPPNLTAGPPPATTTAVDNTAPQVAPTGSAQQSGALTPAAAGMPKVDNTAHNAALALLILVAMAVVASGTTSMQRSPRLLGGASRHAAAAGAGAGVAATAVAMPITTRGLGRFARERVAPPRPLV
ncbi:MAG TPA: hypothetical protein VFJ17_01630 [Mycobacteriales bacterium]|jgi:hypothetical protein|nr:hypothetical protein [Mycobacteriales bacterium]